jgi:hypothetical protein
LDLLSLSADERLSALQSATRQLIAGSVEYRLMCMSVIEAASLGEGESLDTPLRPATWSTPFDCATGRSRSACRRYANCCRHHKARIFRSPQLDFSIRTFDEWRLRSPHSQSTASRAGRSRGGPAGVAIGHREEVQ